MKVLALTILLASQAATADIAARVAAGKSAMTSAEGTAYNTGIMAGILPQALRTCIPPGTTTPGFQLTLVGNVSASGAVREIEVEPANEITACLAKLLGNRKLPAPPPGLVRKGAFPLLIEVKMTNGEGTQSPRPRTIIGNVTPVFSQLVAYSIPDSFAPAFERGAGDSYMQQLVPRGQSAEQWSQMIMLTGARDKALDPAATPQDFADGIASRFGDACPGTFASRAVGKLKISGYDAVISLVGCGAVQSGAPRSEVSLIVAIKGRSDMYAIQWAERAEPGKQAPVLDIAKWSLRLQQLSPILVCDRVPGEAAPFPSCISGSVKQ